MELFRALGALAEAPSEQTARLAALLELAEPPQAGEYERLFVFQLYPWASVYLGPEGKLGGEARDRIAGFWRALELEPPEEPDHLALMLGLYARLAELEEQASSKAARQGWRKARKAWLWEHLLSWLPVYLAKAATLARAESPFYTRWAELVGHALIEEARELGAQERLPLHLREAPALEDPRGAIAGSERDREAGSGGSKEDREAGSGGSKENREAGSRGAEDFLDSLLSPVRAGFILVASDLARVARKAGIGLRAGERRYVLRALLSQDASATLTGIGRLAAEGSRLPRSGEASLEPIEDFWRRRAERTSALLTELAADAAAERP